jgi:hypothetical protein
MCSIPSPASNVQNLARCSLPSSLLCSTPNRTDIPSNPATPLLKGVHLCFFLIFHHVSTAQWFWRQTPRDAYGRTPVTNMARHLWKSNSPIRPRLSGGARRRREDVCSRSLLGRCGAIEHSVDKIPHRRSSGRFPCRSNSSPWPASAPLVG